MSHNVQILMIITNPTLGEFDCANNDFEELGNFGKVIGVGGCAWNGDSGIEWRLGGGGRRLFHPYVRAIPMYAK